MSLKRGQKTGLDSVVRNGDSPTPASTSTSPANAWSRPLQQKAQKSPPGIGARMDEEATPKAKTLNASGAVEPSVPTILRERFLHLCLAFVGQKVVVTQTNGAVLEGIFHTSTPFPSLPSDMKNRFVLKACRTLKQASTESVFHAGDGSAAIFPAENVLSIHAKHINLDRATNGGSGTFSGSCGVRNKADILRTDTEISGGKVGRNRDLVVAGSSWTATNTSGKSRVDSFGRVDEKGAQRKGFGQSAGGNGGLRGSIGEWDQFKANQELFNVSASFDENLYTTELDKSSMDAKKIAEAERIAREIENTSSSNIHIAEERGHIVQGDYDEEDLYSGVLNDDGTARHGKSDGAVIASSELNASSKEASDAEINHDEPKGDNLHAPRKMNYAAAAARHPDAGAKMVPPGFSLNRESTPSPDSGEKRGGPNQHEKASWPATSAGNVDSVNRDGSQISKKVSIKTGITLDGNSSTTQERNDVLDDKSPIEPCNETSDVARETPKEEEKGSMPSLRGSKLNAKAKSFTPVFALGGASAAASDGLAQPQAIPDPAGAMQLPPGSHPIQAPHYIHQGPIGQPGLLPMINPQFTGVRYQTPYGGMEPHVPQIQAHQAPHAQPPPSSASGSSVASVQGNAEIDAGNPEGDTSQQPPPPQPQQLQMAYNVPPPGAYFGAGMTLHPRGPGYPPQFVGAPQQVPVGPAGAPYRQLYPMQPGGMPPNLHLRGPTGAPYYPGPNGPIPYPPGSYVGHSMMDDSDQGFRGRGRVPTGRGRRARSGRGRGPGRGTYASYGNPHGSSGRGHQNQASSGDSAAVLEGSNPAAEETEALPDNALAGKNASSE